MMIYNSNRLINSLTIFTFYFSMWIVLIVKAMRDLNSITWSLPLIVKTYYVNAFFHIHLQATSVG
ncbi:hypothetical protein BD770DRAFT_155469 [Pilaira anomala]|nr:hypothetical protein BD770DRAFT_155469 [Pilaira anomala]